MTTENAPHLLSYDEYAAIDDGLRYQVVEGELIEMPSPTFRHQVLVGAIYVALHAYAKQAKAGTVLMAPFDVVLRSERPAVVLQPDVLFMSTERKRLHLNKANLAGPPDLVVEVLSPSTAKLDTVRKSKLYAQYGVDECWFVTSDFDRVEVWARTTEGTYGFPQIFAAGQTLTTPLLPGFELAIDALFAEADED